MAELHFYNHHVPDYQIPYACVPCAFKTDIRKKPDRHLESPNHRENVYLQGECVHPHFSDAALYCHGTRPCEIEKGGLSPSLDRGVPGD